MTVLILGGGISGLSTAYYLMKKLPPTGLSIWEATNRTGGWIKSSKNEHGIIFEQGPRTLRPRNETGINTLNLIEELQLGSDIRPVLSNSPAAKNRLIYVNHKLHSLPSSLLSLFKKMTPFSEPLIKCLMNEHKIPKRNIQDESIYDFVERRLGSEAADYLISPIICGICAGNAKEVSVHFLASKLFEYEQNYGSITKGLIYNLFRKKEKFQNSESALLKKMERERWSIYSFKNGLESLPLKLREVLETEGVEMHLNRKCEKIDFDKNEIVLHHSMNSVKSKHVFSTLQSEELAKLIKGQHNDLCNLLEKIKNVNVIVVNLHYKGSIIKEPAFGFLIPPKMKSPILGVIYDTCCFEQAGDTVLTVMMGGFWFEKYFSKLSNHDEFYEIALSNLNKILNLDQVPASYKVNVLEKCIPQYVVGHKDTVKKINVYIEKHNIPLSIGGMSYNGVGVNDVILSARKSVEHFFDLKNYIT